MSENDYKAARERNKKLKHEGKSVSDRVATITKRMTAGKLVVGADSFHLNEFILQQVEKRQVKIIEKQEDARKKDELKYCTDCYKAHQAEQRNQELIVMKWKTAGDIWDYLRPLRQKDDAAMSQ